MTDESTPEEERPSIQFHVAPDLDYVYRDVFNVYVGPGDVLIEFGNLHRSMPEHVTIANRITLSLGNAYTLIQTLNQALQQAQVQLQNNLHCAGPEHLARRLDAEGQRRPNTPARG